MINATRIANPRAPAGAPYEQRVQSNALPRAWLITAILLVALLAFELFNFDTTRYALDNLLGDVRFAGVRWATILAIAFCGIDFAGLLRIFTPDDGGDGTPREVWYLLAAWLLGATMNAAMTWYAVVLTLSNHTIGNQVIPQERLIQIVPIFVALLVWLTRILFIGALSLSGLHMQTVGRPAQPEAPAAGAYDEELPTLVAEPVMTQRARRPTQAAPGVTPVIVRPGNGRVRPASPP